MSPSTVIDGQASECPFVKDPVTIFCIHAGDCNDPCDSVIDIPEDDRKGGDE